jgi:hypothetical protein
MGKTQDRPKQNQPIFFNEEAIFAAFLTKAGDYALLSARWDWV